MTKKSLVVIGARTPISFLAVTVVQNLAERTPNSFITPIARFDKEHNVYKLAYVNSTNHPTENSVKASDWMSNHRKYVQGLASLNA